MNKVILIGRIGKTPEVRTLDNGTKVANFSLATSEHYKDKNTGAKKEVTEWHNITAWRGTADIVQKYINKGSLVAIEGRIKTRSWEKDGVTRYTTEILTDGITMLGSSNNNGNKSGEVNGNVSDSVPTSGNNSSDDLPF